MLVAEEGLFTGEERAGEGPGPEPLTGTRDEEEEEVGRDRWQGWAESKGAWSMPLSGSGRKAEMSASAPSRASEHVGPAGRAVKKEQGAGWAGGRDGGI